MAKTDAYYTACSCPNCATKQRTTRTLGATTPFKGFIGAFKRLLKTIYTAAAAGERFTNETELVDFVQSELFDLTKSELLKPINQSLEQVADEAMLNALRANVAVFSGAKTLKQLREMTDSLLNENGELKSFSKFKADTKEIYKNYNENWLRAEYTHAESTATSIARWETFQEEKEAVPNLQYQTTGDPRVRQSHEILDNIIKPIGDDFWKTYYPPNGWNCRCTVVQTNEPAETDISKIELPALKDMFRGNAAIDGIIFPDNHPYFDLSNEAKTALNNI